MPENTLSRRSLATSALWSVPVVAVAVATPAAAASAPPFDLVVTSSCVPGRTAYFTVTEASGGTIPAGTVLTITSSALLFVTLSTTGAVAGRLGAGRTTRTLTVGADTPLVTVELWKIVGLFAAATFTVSLTSLPAGHVDSTAANDSASVALTGVAAAGGLFAGVCS